MDSCALEWKGKYKETKAIIFLWTISNGYNLLGRGAQQLQENINGCKFSREVTTPCFLAIYGDNAVKYFGYRCGSLTSPHARPSQAVTESFEDL